MKLLRITAEGEIDEVWMIVPDEWQDKENLVRSESAMHFGEATDDEVKIETVAHLSGWIGVQIYRPFVG